MRSKDNYSRKNNSRSRKLAPANYLIVCEGKETEPNYFTGLKRKINEKYGSKVDVFIPSIKVEGTGRNTTDLVNYTSRCVNYSSKRYAKVWVVFDKDDYSDTQYDTAIRNCQGQGFNAIWSNPNFELWLLAHFKRINGYISKDDVITQLEREFQRNNLGEYSKNDDKVFEKVTANNGLQIAINNCKAMESLEENKLPSRRNPMTKVYTIVDDLKNYIN